MDRWQSLIDRQVREILGDGRSTGLPGAGKPLKLDDDVNTPAELRMAHRILRDNGLAPDWMLLGRELEEKREQLLESLRRSAHAYQSARTADPLLQRQAEKAWQTAQRRFFKEVEYHNKQVNTYNLKVPPGVGHKAQIKAEREIQRALEDGAR